MPIKQTKFIRNLKKQYGKRWKEVFFAFKKKSPRHPAVLKAEGKTMRKRKAKKQFGY